MKEKKHIDRLYQETFKDFEATPSEAVWRSISARLAEKEEKKPVITPFWSRMAGIAAIFTLILLIGEWIFPEKAPAVANENIDDRYREKVLFPGIGIAFNAGQEQSSSSSRKAMSDEAAAAGGIIPAKEVSSITSETTTAEGGVAKKETKIASAEMISSKEEENKKPSLFEAIEKQQLPAIAESRKGNFEISTHAAPIYYGNFGKGNFLDPQFNRNSSQGEITYSYGINIAYAISDKIKIRSGVSKVNMSYNTNGIVYSAIIGPVPLSSVAMESKKEAAQMTAGIPGTSNKVITGSERATVGSLLPGMMNQKMGFIEVPVELEYNLIDRKFELNIIGGASTLFLDQNSLSVDAGSFTAVGKATNLNDISFSTNIGLGLDYNLSEKFKLNLEPMLKYQLNTFNAASSDNQPFYLGIYSGFSYKF